MAAYHIVDEGFRRGCVGHIEAVTLGAGAYGLDGGLGFNVGLCGARAQDEGRSVLGQHTRRRRADTPAGASQHHDLVFQTRHRLFPGYQPVLWRG